MYKKFIRISNLILFFIYLISHYLVIAKEKSINNFSQAKLAAIKINKDIPGTFYCGCHISWYGKKGVPDLNSCGYKIRKNELRANRIEWEHVVPAWEFGHNFKCWKEGKRKFCRKDPNYRRIENDLHNLQPVIGEINGDRENYQYDELKSSTRQYGCCEMKIDFKNRKVEPPIRSRGIIARTYLYMKDKYNISISQTQNKLFNIWNKKYPVTKWECERNKRIASIQGNLNPYVTQECNKLNY